MAKKPEVEMRLTPKMIATHLDKKPYVIIVTAMENKHYAKVNEPLPDAVIKAIYTSLRAKLPTTAEVEMLKKFTPQE